ncbi:MAG TPA: hypothetical protein DCP90_03760 [Clostridiales bacterium]|nr:MAG: hypothetical protein A2Y22_05275 [Clostridiales bacterium GWD2_32_59]HAN09711.1 hypothetical protein [Clostridiales bacterium]
MNKLEKLIGIILILIMVVGTNASFAATDAEVISEVNNKLTFYRGTITGDVTSDMLTEVQALKDKVNTISDYDQKTKLMENVLVLITDMSDILTGKDLEIITSKIKFLNENEELYLSLPDTKSRYTYSVLVENSDLGVEMIKCNAKQNEKIALPTLKKATNLKYTIQILYGTVTKKTATSAYMFKDTEMPKIKAIYVLDNNLYVKTTDNYKFADEKYAYTVGEDTYETNSYYKIKEYPKTIAIKVKDLFGNVNSYTVNATQDAKVYFGDASDSIDEDINEARESKITTSRYFKNIVIGEYGKELYYYDAFDTYLKKKFGNSYNKKYVTPSSSSVTVDLTKKVVILNKDGVFELKFKNSKDNTVVSTYIVVGDKNDKIESYYSKIRHKLPNYVTVNSISLANYIELVPNSKYSTSGANSKYILIMVDDVAYSVNSTIPLTNKNMWNIYIYNLSTGEFIDHEIYYKKLEKRIEILNDIKNHWAKNSIISLIERNVVTGYSDLTFKPNSTVTVKEFVAMLNRLNPNKSRETINLNDVGLSKYDWAYYEVKNVFSKLDYQTLFRSGLMNKYDYPITREEVAMLVANYYQVPEKPTEKYYVDLTQSSYSSEIQKLTASGILKGYDDNTVRPFSYLTRAEAVTILGRIN